MKALGEGHGALLVDPSSVDSIAHAMMELLDNDEVLESLRREARKLPRSSWDDYSALVWSKIASDRG
jgi:glycosyltransferase involved in cell wall biosynthesis